MAGGGQGTRSYSSRGEGSRQEARESTSPLAAITVSGSYAENVMVH